MRKVAIGSAVLAVVGGLVFLATTFWQASSSLKNATARVAQEGLVPFRVIPLDRPLPTGFESISAPAQFRDATLFQGRFYLCGPPGLFAYDVNGSLVAQYRPGLELPPAPLVAMASGIGSGKSEPQLWIATAGEGLLTFDGRKFLQIRPDDQSSRSLSAILPLSSGRVLLGAGKGGVLVWDGQSLARYHSALNDLQVTALAGSEADLWVGTIDRGLFRWHAGQLDHFAEAEGLPDPRILSIVVEGGAAYAGTALGVAEFRDGRFTRILAGGFFAKALLIKGDSLAVGTLDEGVLDVPLTVPKPRIRDTADESNLDGVERLFTLEGRTYALARGAYGSAISIAAWTSSTRVSRAPSTSKTSTSSASTGLCTRTTAE